MQVELRKAFHDKVKAFALDNDLRIAFPNVDFKPTDEDKIYLRVLRLPVKPSTHGVNNGASEYIWIMQVSVYARDGDGELRPLGYADELRTTVFPIHSKLSGANHSFKVITPPNPTPSVQMPDWYSIPVRFTVQAIT